MQIPRNHTEEPHSPSLEYLFQSPMHGPDYGDYVGVESCVDLKSEVEGPSHDGGGSRQRRRRAEVDREYPPPIPMLARTQNLPSHMPWVMKKYYTGDGRLIIKEEKVKRHEYFQAHRSNGRLVLNLVLLDDVVEEACREHRAREEEFSAGIPTSGEEISGDDKGIGDSTVEEAVPELGKCNGKVKIPCGGFAAAVAALRPPFHA